MYVRLDNDGRTIWDVFKARRFLGNTRVDLCSRVLKREPMRAWLDEHADPAATVVHLGFDWTEGDRITNGAGHWAPWYVDNPLLWEPMLDKAQAIAAVRAAGIEPPALTRAGFPHANCGGGCVKAGIKQWRKLLAERPDTYDEWEAGEADVRAHLGKDVTILRDRRGGNTRPMTLTELRERVAAEPDQPTQGDLFGPEDWGSCSCLTPEATDVAPAPHPDVPPEQLAHVVMLSSGVASAVAAKRVAERFGTARLTLLFADVNGEDADNYRFLDEVVPWVLG